MAYRRLLIFVEGPEDEDFFDQILKPYLKSRYKDIRFYRYARKKNELISNFIKSAKSMGDFIFIIDYDKAKCKTKKLESIKNKYKNIEINRIQIVIEEIESWYIAGLSKEDQLSLGIKFQVNTDELTKEDFENFMKNKFDSLEDFKVEVLKHFDFEIAKKRNKSFKYFVEKYIEPT